MQQITYNENSAALRRILFVAELPADRDEIQRINLGDIGSGDTFTLTFNGQTTSSISYNATPATLASNIDTALEALSNIDASAITVAHVSGNSYDVTFGGNLASTDVPLMTITPTGFTPTGITEIQHGGVALSPALHVTFAAADILVSKNGATEATSQGSVTEIGSGRYYYEAHPEEVNALGFLSLAITRDDISVIFPTVQVVAASSALGAPVLRSGTAQAGAASTITLDADASSLSNYYVPAVAYLRTGTGAGQARLIHAYNGSTKVASVEPNWVTPPDATTVFDLLPTAPLLADVLRANHAAANTFGETSTVNDIRDAILADSTPFNGADVATAAGLLDLTAGVETGLTLRQALRLLVAMAAGKISGASTATVTIRNFGDSKDRIVAVVDANGNRSTITTDLT